MMHHAYVVIGGREDAAPYLKKEGSVSIDRIEYAFDRFGIDEARTLKKDAHQKPIESTHRIFVVSFETITTEAQNALLKLFEEPPVSSRFYLVVKDASVFLPTLASRLHFLAPVERQNEGSTLVQSFLKQSYAARLACIAKKMKEKDTNWAAALLDGLEEYAEGKKDPQLFSDLIFVRRYFDTKGASKKMLLEHLALQLPDAP